MGEDGGAGSPCFGAGGECRKDAAKRGEVSLGVSAFKTLTPTLSRVQARESERNRRVSDGEACRGGDETCAGGGQADSDSARDLRPDGTASNTRGGGDVPERFFGGGV